MSMCLIIGSCMANSVDPDLHCLPGPRGYKVIKLFSYSSQLSMKFSLLINMKMPTIVGIFIFISIEIFMLSYA